MTETGRPCGHGHPPEARSRTGWLGNRGLLGVLVLLGGVLAATVVGVVAFWPKGAGSGAVAEGAGQEGLTSERFAAQVQSVREAPCSYSTAENPQNCRAVVVVPSSGPDAQTPVTLPEFNLEQTGYVPDPAPGDRIVVGYEPATDFYFYADVDRRVALWVLAGLFAVFVLVLGRLRGLRSLISTALTGLLLVGFVAPSILDGHEPLLVAVVAASVIAFASFYLTHGPGPETTIALAGTLGSLGLTLGISALFFGAARFTGVATEEGAILSFVSGGIDLSSLLLAGAMIGALGALDDVTITQAVAVAELRRADPTMGASRLIAAGLRVGRAHIASTINTLLLAYVGAAMPLLLLFAVSDQSWGMVANSELIAVEIARTLCGSIGLVAAVPLVTALAAVLGGEERAGRAGDGSGARTRGSFLRARLRRQPAEAGGRAATWDDFTPQDELDF
ncbi:MAG: YibE/F family protein [bacterium]|nr:YibE/F family protein [bacterium]